ncbi:PepSY domain-containing protein [Roseibium sp.]|uniref:PepSY domain-containing protein n=1 Tax=Roseibium sp. TaxID=1936156 RepID=UPI003B52B4D7
MTTFIKHTAVTVFASAIGLAGAGAALAAVTLGDDLGTTEEEVRAALTSQGYTITEIETENGELEAEVVLDGQEMEIVIDTTSGLVLEMELEDGADSDEDDDD